MITREAAIIGGSTDTGDPEVFEMFIQANNNSGAVCTATLIDKHTLLTAAHCVDPRTVGATQVQLFVHNKANDNQVGFSDLIRVTETRMHPGWQGQGSNDIALAYLQTAPAAAVKPWNMQTLAGMSGKPLRAVGYGANRGGANPTGSGVKRQVALTFTMIYQDVFFLGDGTGKGVCHGDSGGPSFFTFADGVERVVGVHSFTTNEACTTGADTRVDAFQSFIKQWLNEKEQPSCSDDGRCASNCPQVDLDCVCGNDGQCTAACPNLQKDPDCPIDCGTNGVCSLVGCPVPDADCVPHGTGCSSNLQCDSRRCIGPAPNQYCTVTCTSDAQCFEGAACDLSDGTCKYASLPLLPVGEICNPTSSFCADGSRCTGPTPDYAYCSLRCSSQADCTQPNTPCEVGFDGLKYCKAPPRAPIILPGLGKVEDNSASCSAVGGVWPALAAVLLARRRKRAP